ncbi:MBL fold metallo-hydrolase [bacterium]|nr:MBL fold metallo-hydrolase [bacterium]
MVRVKWTGAAGLQITHEGRTWLIDPYHTRSGKGSVLFGKLASDEARVAGIAAGLPGELSGVIVGHTHFDHALDIPWFARQTTVPIVGSASLETLLGVFGIAGRVTVCRGGEEQPLPGGATVKMIPSRHGLVLFGRVPYPGEVEPGGEPPLPATRYRVGGIFAPLINVGGKSILHMGSANLVDEALEGARADIVFMCIPGWKRTPDYHKRVLSRVRPSVVVPFHFDDFTRPFRADGSAPDLPFFGQPAKDEFARAIAACAPDARIVFPRTNETLEL